MAQEDGGRVNEERIEGRRKEGEGGGGRREEGRMEGRVEGRSEEERVKGRGG